MKAMTIREFGEPEVMRLEDVPTPVPGPGEVLLQVHAVSVNRTLDLAVRAGKYALPVKLPHVLGVDPSGVVAAIGEGVTTRKPGDRVTTWTVLGLSPAGFPIALGVHVWGGYAEYVIVPAASTFPLPDALDFPAATVVARHAPQAFNLLRDEAKLQPGEWVLVMGAAGGLGSAGVQIAKHLGGRVIAAAGAASRVEAALALGAEFGIDYRRQDLPAEIMRITGGRGVAVVFENIGDPELFPKAVASLARRGRLVTSGGHGGGTVPLDISRLYLNNLSIIGSFGRLVPGDMETALEMAAQGRYAVLIDQIMPLSAAAEAHRLTAERGGVGKIILEPQRSR